MNYGQKCDISNFVAHEKKNSFPCFPVMLPWQKYTLTTTIGSERQYERQLR